MSELDASQLERASIITADVSMVIIRFMAVWADETITTVVLDHGLASCANDGWHSVYKLNGLVYSSVFHWDNYDSASTFHKEIVEAINKTIEKMAGQPVESLNFN